MTIEITKEQAQVLINLIDVAVKAGGIQAARAGVFFTDLVSAAAAKEESLNKEQKEVQ
jgi:polyhydroxyalkanoate synthesis regulator phasin